jgi:hypothetical protein
MKAEQYNREMDNEIRSKRIFTVAMLRDFGLAYSQDSASGANWLIGKLQIAKEILQSGGSIEIAEETPITISSITDLESWIRQRYPGFSDDV